MENGPTTLGMPGNPVNPNAARLICCTDAYGRALISGRSWLSARSRAARISRISSDVSASARLYWTPRAIASAVVRSITSFVASPDGTLPRYWPLAGAITAGSWTGDPCELREDGAGVVGTGNCARHTMAV